jgi:predicted NBD/HSP70 family sugar kinase
VPSLGASELLAIVAAKGEVSRAQIAELAGLNRVTVAQRLTELFEAELIEEGEQSPSTGGRPTRPIRLNRKFGGIAVADVGETTISLAITDLSASILAQASFEFDPRTDPGRTVAKIAEHFKRLTRSAGLQVRDLIGACLGIRAPVDFDAGVVVGPSIMVGWDNVDIGALLNKHIDVPTYIENDVNLLSIAAVKGMPNIDDMFFVKAGTGIGSGMIFDGRIYRGANGAAGDIGHIQFGDFDAPLCRCGKRGCVEARAAGWALARDLRARGFQAQDARDVMRLVRDNEPEAIHLVRRAGQVLGEAIADCVSLLNPSVIIVGGTLSGAGEHLLGGIRELVYQRCLPLATRGLQIIAAQQPAEAGLIGGAHLVLEMQLSAKRIGETIRRHFAA